MQLLDAFGAKIRTLREGHSISQARLSELSGIMRDQISRIENGQVNVTIETILKLSVALDVSMKEIVDFEVDNMIIPFINVKNTCKLKPFVKWAGGKSQLLEVLESLLPKSYNTYYEPFVGAGALFLSLRPNKAVINDFNGELISSYKCFQNEDKFKKMIKSIKVHEENHSEEYYYEVRNLDREKSFNKAKDYEKAARFIYLNKAGFNGLYRVNSKGYFNVPSGKKDKVKGYDKVNFDSLFAYLSTEDITIYNDDFSKAVETVTKGDFVYFDPPYDSWEEKESFTSYSKNGFGKSDQKRLSQVFRQLDQRGVKMMLSNHNTEFIRQLYEGFNINIVNATRRINSNAKGRGNVEEVIITNY